MNMNKSFFKNINTFLNERKEIKKMQKEKPILSMRSITEHNVSNINEYNFLEILEFIIDDINTYKENVIKHKYYKKYAEKGSLKEAQIKMIFIELINVFNRIMKDSLSKYEEYKDKNETAAIRFLEIIGDPTATLKVKRDGLLSTYNERLLRIEEMLLLLDTLIDENKPEILLSSMINYIKDKEIFAGVLLHD